MDNKIDLTKFCERRSGCRDFLYNPFNVGDKTVATNGHIMIVVQKLDCYDSNKRPNHDHINKTISKIPEDGYKPIPDIKWPEKETCNTCKGSGKAEVKECEECEGCGEVDLENDFHEYEAECKSCRGKGEITVVNTKTDCHYCKGDGKMFCGFPAPIVKLESMSFNPYYLEMFVEMPNVKYQLGENKAYFNFDGGYGLIMACIN